MKLQTGWKIKALQLTLGTWDINRGGATFFEENIYIEVMLLLCYSLLSIMLLPRHTSSGSRKLRMMNVNAWRAKRLQPKSSSIVQDMMNQVELFRNIETGVRIVCIVGFKF